MTRIWRCVVVDDEQGAIDVLTNYIQKTPGLELLNSFQDPVQALAYIQEQQPDLLFVDINMPDLNGLELSKLIKSSPVRVIFHTAYSQYAVESYEIEATDYLLKPVAFERFLQAISRLPAVRQAEQVEQTSGHHQIFIKSGTEIRQINTAEIRYLQKDGHYIVFKLADREVLSRMTIADALEVMPEKHFLQVHRSYIIGLDHVEIIQKQFAKIGSSEIPIGDNFKEAFFKQVQFSGS